MYSNIDEVVMHKLKENFEGTCRENSLIVKILKIIKRSKCRISKNHLDGTGSVNVLYLAEAVTYQPGDILPVCEIIRIEKNHKIFCKYDTHTNAWINGGKTLRGLRQGQKISILILGVKYGKENNSIIIYGIPYVYPHKFHVFIVGESSENMAAEDIEIVSAKMGELAQQKELLDQVDSKARDFFSKLYYPFKRKPSEMQKLLPKQITEEHLENIDIQKGCVYFRHPIIDKHTDIVLTSELESFKKSIESEELFDPEVFKTELVVESPVRILLYMLEDYIKFLRLIQELCVEFDSEENIKKQNNVWEIYRKIKKP